MQYCFGSDDKTEEDKSVRSIVKKKYLALKQSSGSHSPSAGALQRAIPEIDLKIDCCYLSNPYATQVFMTRLKADFADEKWLHGIIESYPSQNRQVAVDVSKAIGARPENIFVVTVLLRSSLVFSLTSSRVNSSLCFLLSVLIMNMLTRRQPFIIILCLVALTALLVIVNISCLIA